MPAQERGNGEPEGDLAVAPSFSANLWQALNIIVPTALGNAVEYLPVCFAVAIVGRQARVGAESAMQVASEVDALSLARAYFNLVAMAPGFGLITALRTLCPQAVGAGRPAQCALAVQRAMIFVCAYALVALPLLYTSDRVLILAGQPPDLAALAQPYCVRLLPQYFGCICMSAVQRVYQAHHLNWANFGITATVCACAPVLQWGLVHWAGMGYLGAAWAASAYNLLYLVLQVPHLSAVGHAYVFCPQPWRALVHPAGLREYALLMLPGWLMSVLEWWVLEAVVFLAGRLADPVVTLGTLAVTANVQALAVMTWIGCAVAGATLVGRAVGAGKVAEAQSAARAVLTLTLVLAVAISGPLVVFREAVPRLFTPDRNIDALTAQTLPVLGAVMVTDALSNALGGVFSGLGRQRLAAGSQLVGYYLVGMPLGLFTAFRIMGAREEGVFALWGGVGISMAVASLLQGAVLCRTDWRACAVESEARILVSEATLGAEGIHAGVGVGWRADEGLQRRLLADHDADFVGVAHRTAV